MIVICEVLFFIACALPRLTAFQRLSVGPAPTEILSNRRLSSLRFAFFTALATACFIVFAKGMEAVFRINCNFSIAWFGFKFLMASATKRIFRGDMRIYFCWAFTRIMLSFDYFLCLCQKPLDHPSVPMECPGRRKFSQSMPHHCFRNIDFFK